MNTFIDNVSTLVVESCLVVDMTSIFSSVEVCSFSDEDLSRLAAESQESRTIRQGLKQKRDCLNNGIDVCRRHSKYITGK